MSITKPSVVDITYSRGYCDTHFLNSKKFSYTWTIHNFSHTVFHSDGSNLETPNFETFHNRIIISWYLRLLRQASSQSGQGEDMRILLYGKVSKECKIAVTSEFSFINENIEQSIKVVATIKGAYKPVQDLILECPDCYIAKREKLIAKDSGFCPNDKLIIVCDIALETDPLCSTSNEHDRKQRVPKCQLVRDIGALFGNKDFCDVKLTVKGKDFHAHKNVLSARSSVFSAMFKYRMAENVNNTVDITDINHDVFEEVLRYIYTGTTSSLTDEIAMELMVAADKYELDRLKIICEVFIGENMTKDNVTDILIVADAHRSTMLKTKALEFISTHMKNVMNTNGYKSMLESHRGLIGECFIILTDKLKQIGSNK